MQLFKKRKKTTGGSSIVFVLAALIVISIIGITMLKLVNSDRVNNAFYSTSASARNAAKSGIISAIHSFEEASNVDANLALLQRWADSKNISELSAADQWIVGSADSYQNLSETEMFRTKLLAFDSEKFNITLMSEGIGKGGARATTIALYNLGGLEFGGGKTTISGGGNIPRHALQLDNGNFEFNVNIVIDGSTAVKKKLTMNSGSVLFKGNFRVDTSDEGKASKTVFNIPIKFEGDAYFACEMEVFSPLDFNGNVAFAADVQSKPKDLIFKKSDGSIFMAGGFESNFASGTIDANDNTVYLYGVHDDYRGTMPKGVTGRGINIFHNKNAATSSLTPSEPRPDFDDIDSLVSHDFAARDTAIHFNRDIIDVVYKTFVHTDRGDITASKMNTWYNTARDSNPDQLWNGFLVLKFEPGGDWPYYPFADDGSEFKGKVIILNNDPYVMLRNFYESSDSAITALYIKENDVAEPIFKSVEFFRGFIYVANADPTLVFQQSVNSEIKGSVYYAKTAKSKFDGSAAYTTTFTYDSTALNELAACGLFSVDGKASVSVESGDLQLKKSYTNIIADLVSRSM